MTTVQLAIRDSGYAQSLRNLLLRDGTHRVLLVDKPDLREEGVVVMEANGFENLSLLSSQPERFVVITRKGTDHLTRIGMRECGTWYSKRTRPIPLSWL